MVPRYSNSYASLATTTMNELQYNAWSSFILIVKNFIEIENYEKLGGNVLTNFFTISAAI